MMAQSPERKFRPQGAALMAALLYSSLVLVGCGAGGGGGGDGGTPGTTSAGTLGESTAATGGVATLTGTVRNLSTAVGVPGAQVQAGGQTTFSDATGSYLLTNVPAGTLLIVTNATGFSSSSRVAFLAAGGTTQLDIALSPSSSSGTGGTSGTGPIVASSNPDAGDTDVDPSSQILITFDQDVIASTVTPANIVFTRTAPTSAQDGGTPSITLVTGTTRTFRYTPGSLQMEAGSSYGIFVTNRVQGTNGLFAPGSNFTWTTRTGSGGSGGTADPPNITFSSPMDGATDVDVGSDIIFQFEQAMNTSTVTIQNDNIILAQITSPARTDTVSPNIVPVSGLINGFRFIPSSGGANPFFPFSPGTTYSLFITNKVLSSSGVPSLGEDITFTTRSVSGTPTGPTILSFNPDNNAQNIDLNSNVLVTFDRPILGTSLTGPGAISLTKITPSVQPAAIVASLDPNNSSRVVIDPVLPLDEQSQYRVVISNQVTSQAPINPTTGGSSVFTTVNLTGGGGTGTIIPTLQSSNPSDTTSGVDVNARILLTFSTAMIEASLDAPGSIIVTQGGNPATDLATVQVTPTAITNTFEIIQGETGLPFPLVGNTTYTVFLSNQIQAAGASGGFLQPDSFTFTTRPVQGGAGDITPPQLALINPPNLASNVDINVQILFSFTELVKVDSFFTSPTFNVTAVTLTQTSAPTAIDIGQSVVPLNVTDSLADTGTVSAASDFLYVAGSLQLSPSAQYRVSFSNLIQDLQGNRLNPTTRDFSTSDVQISAQGPRLASSNPIDGSSSVEPTSSILFSFDKDVNVDTVNPTNVIFSRITSPAANDDTQSATITRPAPDTLPRLFEYVPGSLALQPGLNRYNIFISNRVLGTDGTPSPGDTFTFTTKDTTVTPGLGPRIIGTNPGFGVTVGGAPRILIQFDKPVSLDSGNVTLGLIVQGIGQPGADLACNTPDDESCIPPPVGSDAILGCNCSAPFTITEFRPVGDQFGLNDEQVIEIVYTNPTAANFPVTTYISLNGFLVDDNNQPAPDDFTFFFTP